MTQGLSEADLLLVLIDGLALDRVVPTPGRVGIEAGLTTEQVEEIARALMREGLLSRAVDDDGVPYYVVTAAGSEDLAGIFRR